jgi:flagellar biosynthetic protein FliR
MTDLTGQLTELAQLSQGLIWAMAIVFLRIAAAMAIMPGFGEQMIPIRVRLGLAIAFTAIVAPAVAPLLPGPETSLPRMILTETLSGLVLGLVLRLFIHVLQMAGMIIAQSTSLSQLFAGAQLDPQPSVGFLLTLAGLALAMSADLHVLAAKYLIFSYEVLPPGRLPGSADIADWGVMRIAEAFQLAFSLAAPFVIAALLYNLALGVINRAMPQMMVAFVGAPALALGGLLLLAVLAPLTMAIWLSAFSSFLQAPFVPRP